MRPMQPSSALPHQLHCKRLQAAELEKDRKVGDDSGGTCGLDGLRCGSRAGACGHSTAQQTQVLCLLHPQSCPACILPQWHLDARTQCHLQLVFPYISMLTPQQNGLQVE